MSDDNTTPSNQYLGSNIGITLPEGENATYDLGLSPLFQARSGGLGSNAISNRGREAYLYSSNTKSYQTAIRLNANIAIYPSRYDGNRIYPLSLRCLVSTNNKIMDKDIMVIFEPKISLIW